MSCELRLALIAKLSREESFEFLDLHQPWVKMQKNARTILLLKSENVSRPFTFREWSSLLDIRSSTKYE